MLIRGEPGYLPYPVDPGFMLPHTVSTPLPGGYTPLPAPTGVNPAEITGGYPAPRQVYPGPARAPIPTGTLGRPVQVYPGAPRRGVPVRGRVRAPLHPLAAQIILAAHARGMTPAQYILHLSQQNPHLGIL
jgi:hypothetical protein